MYDVRPLSATGFRGARLEHARAGAATVVYTDRELTRLLLDHYASLKNMPGDRRIMIEGARPHSNDEDDDDDIAITGSRCLPNSPKGNQWPGQPDKHIRRRGPPYQDSDEVCFQLQRARCVRAVRLRGGDELHDYG